MAASEFDLLTTKRGLVVAPAGCGKTQLIADALKRHSNQKPILVLTHTNAGVASLRNRLEKIGVKPSKYRLATIDGWAIRLISIFPKGANYDPLILNDHRPNYPKIREAAYRLLKAGHIGNIVSASYARLLVDEYQDCSIRQHAIVYYASMVLPTCVVGDPLQAIFGFGNDPLAGWQKHVCSHFTSTQELDRPWRWINANSEVLGQWLLDVRRKLLAGETINLTTAPASVRWVKLDGNASDHQKLLDAGRVVPPNGNGSVLIIGESTSPDSQRRFASQTPGAVTVESVDLRDLVSFAKDFNINSSDALQQVAEFAQNVMTNVGAADLINRVDIVSRGTGRKAPTEVERAALSFLNDRRPQRIVDFLVGINKEGGVRSHRPDVLRACIRALQICARSTDVSFYEAAVQVREQSRLVGRPIPRRAVGSTLLLKGLEAEVVVILDADSLDARNLYVAMTRGSKSVIICSRSSVLNPTL